MNSLAFFFGRMGRNCHSFFFEIGSVFDLVGSFFYWSFIAPLFGLRKINREAFARQMVFVGNESFFIVALVTASIGAVLALQSAYQLKQFGALIYTGGLVSVSITRELGPVVTAIIMTGRVGASITAELGTMKVQEEIDALATMGIPPVSFLVVPRIFSILIMLPCLTMLGDAVGMFGGYLVGTLGLNIGSDLYIQESFDPLIWKDILTGLAKSFVFAHLIGFICCHKGFSVKGGSDSVGRATTEAVVLSIIAIILADCLCTAIFYYVFP